MEADQRVLLLNSTFEPLNIISARRAYKLLFAKKAHAIEQSTTFLHTVRSRLKIPSVIQIAYYIRKPYSRPKFSKKAIFIRDNYHCQYCGKYTNKPTIDHIIPRSKNGRTDWQNVVTACPACNNKKGDRTLKDANMRLLHEPFEPKYVIYSASQAPKNLESWHKYFDHKERPVEAVPVLTTAQ